MSVHQLKDGRWFVQYRVDGKIKREYYGRGSGAERQAKNRDVELDSLKHNNILKSPTFAVLTVDYLSAKAASIEPSTAKILVYKLQANLLPEFGKTEALKITKERVDQFVQKRLLQGRKPSTIHREITDIQAIMNHAVERHLISHNPLVGYKKPRLDPEIVTPPTLSEMKEIDKHAPDHLRRALKIIFYTGARPGREITSITWSNVNWDNDSIRIISARKHGLKYRDVPICDAFKTLLEKWFEEDKKQKDMNIIHYRGGPIISLRKAWRNTKKRAGITRAIIPYSYRHAFVSMLLDSGADLKSVSEMVGHSSPTLTLRVYQHTNKAMHQKAIEKLPDMGW